MKPFAAFLLVLSCILLAATGCSSPASTAGGGNPANGPAEADLSSLAAAQGGNMHFQNLVLAIDSRIVFNSVGGQFSLASGDGISVTTLLETPGSNAAFDGGQLFYIDMTSGGQLKKMALDGSNQVRIGQTPLKYLIAHDQALYAIESNEGLAVSLKMDGTGRKVLSQAQAIALTLAGGFLYITGADDADGLKMIDLASGEETLVLSRRISSLNVSGEWLYFADPADGFRLNAWSATGKKIWKISQFSVDKPFIVSNGFLYYIDTASQNRLYRLPADGHAALDGLSPELVVDDAVGLFAVCGNQVFYQRPSSSRIYRVACTGGQALRIT